MWRISCLSSQLELESPCWWSMACCGCWRGPGRAQSHSQCRRAGCDTHWWCQHSHWTGHCSCTGRGESPRRWVDPREWSGAGRMQDQPETVKLNNLSKLSFYWPVNCAGSNLQPWKFGWLLLNKTGFLQQSWQICNWEKVQGSYFKICIMYHNQSKSFL